MMWLRNADYRYRNADYCNADYWNARLEPHDNWRLEHWSHMTGCGSAMLTTAILTTAILTTAMLTTAMLTTAMLTTEMLTTEMLTAGMPGCPASSQSGTGLRKANDAGTDPVPE
jgi:uncharacterized protein YjbI with pentapeptide repeats